MGENNDISSKHTWNTCPGREILEITSNSQKENIIELKDSLKSLVVEIRKINETTQYLLKNTANGINADILEIHKKMDKVQDVNRNAIARMHKKMDKWLYVFYGLIAVLIATNPQFADLIRRLLPILP